MSTPHFWSFTPTKIAEFLRLLWWLLFLTLGLWLPLIQSLCLLLTLFLLSGPVVADGVVEGKEDPRHFPKSVVTHSPSQIQICDNAIIDQIVFQYESEPGLVAASTSHGQTSGEDSLLPSGEELEGIGVVSSPAAGSGLLRNKFSPLSAKDIEVHPIISDVSSSGEDVNTLKIAKSDTDQRNGDSDKGPVSPAQGIAAPHPIII